MSEEFINIVTDWTKIIVQTLVNVSIIGLCMLKNKHCVIGVAVYPTVRETNQNLIIISTFVFM